MKSNSIGKSNNRIKHEIKFNRKVFHEEENSENWFSELHVSWTAIKSISRTFCVVYRVKLTWNDYFIVWSEIYISQCILAFKTLRQEKNIWTS